MRHMVGAILMNDIFKTDISAATKMRIGDYP